MVASAWRSEDKRYNGVPKHAMPSRQRPLARCVKYMPLKVRIGWYTGPRTPTGCREWAGPSDRDGYGRLKHGDVSYRATRLILGLKRDDPRVAMHVCDNPRCVEPSHLRIGTVQDNTIDAFMKGRRFSPRRRS